MPIGWVLSPHAVVPRRSTKSGLFEAFPIKPRNAKGMLIRCVWLHNLIAKWKANETWQFITNLGQKGVKGRTQVFLGCAPWLALFKLSTGMLVTKLLSLWNTSHDAHAQFAAALLPNLHSRSLIASDIWCFVHRSPQKRSLNNLRWEDTVVGEICRAGQNRISAPCMTVCMVISLLKTPYVHRIYL
jgi:hypothetical protein